MWNNCDSPRTNNKQFCWELLVVTMPLNASRYKNSIGKAFLHIIVIILSYCFGDEIVLLSSGIDSGGFYLGWDIWDWGAGSLTGGLRLVSSDGCIRPCLSSCGCNKGSY